MIVIKRYLFIRLYHSYRSRTGHVIFWVLQKRKLWISRHIFGLVLNKVRRADTDKWSEWKMWIFAITVYRIWQVKSSSIWNLSWNSWAIYHLGFHSSVFFLRRRNIFIFGQYFKSWPVTNYSPADIFVIHKHKFIPLL